MVHEGVDFFLMKVLDSLHLVGHFGMGQIIWRSHGAFLGHNCHLSAANLGRLMQQNRRTKPQKPGFLDCQARPSNKIFPPCLGSESRWKISRILWRFSIYAFQLSLYLVIVSCQRKPTRITNHNLTDTIQQKLHCFKAESTATGPHLYNGEV